MFTAFFQIKKNWNQLFRALTMVDQILKSIVCDNVYHVSKQFANTFACLLVQCAYEIHQKYVTYGTVVQRTSVFHTFCRKSVLDLFTGFLHECSSNCLLSDSGLNIHQRFMTKNAEFRMEQLCLNYLKLHKCRRFSFWYESFCTRMNHRMKIYEIWIQTTRICFFDTIWI